MDGVNRIPGFCSLPSNVLTKMCQNLSLSDIAHLLQTSSVNTKTVGNRLWSMLIQRDFPWAIQWLPMTTELIIKIKDTSHLFWSRYYRSCLSGQTLWREKKAISLAKSLCPSASMIVSLPTRQMSPVNHIGIVSQSDSDKNDFMVKESHHRRDRAAEGA